MIERLSDIARIEAEIAAAKVRIGTHLDELKDQLHPAEIVQDIAVAGLAAAKQIPRHLHRRKAAGALGALAGLALILGLRGSSRAFRKSLPGPD